MDNKVTTQGWHTSRRNFGWDLHRDHNGAWAFFLVVHLHRRLMFSVMRGEKLHFGISALPFRVQGGALMIPLPANPRLSPNAGDETPRFVRDSIVSLEHRYADVINDRYPAAAICASHQDVMDRAISIVMARPYLMDCRRDGETFHHLVTDGTGDAVLTWTRCGSVTRGGLVVERCRFPAWLLDATCDAVSDWQAAAKAAE